MSLQLTTMVQLTILLPNPVLIRSSITFALSALAPDASLNADETTEVGHFLERVRGALLSAHSTSTSIRGSDRG